MKTLLLGLSLSVHVLAASNGCPTPQVILPDPMGRPCAGGSSVTCPLTEADQAQLKEAYTKCGEMYPGKPCPEGMVRFPSGRYEVYCGPRSPKL